MSVELGVDLACKAQKEICSDRPNGKLIDKVPAAGQNALECIHSFPLFCVEGILTLEWEDETEDDELKEVVSQYLPDAVVWTTDWTTGSLIDQLTRGIFNVDPPFQRRQVWDDTRSSLYIESLLLGCPVPPITLAEVTNSASQQYLVIDGKQRLSTLKRFAIDETLILRGLEALTELSGASFRDIQGHAEYGRFENLPIRTNVVRNWKKDEVLHFIFNRLNTQVTPLSTHELRRSLIPGGFMKYLDERSAASASLKRILGISEPDRRLRDSELLLRAIAFSMFLSRYRGNLKVFLDSAARRLNNSWTSKTQSEVAGVVNDIEEAIDATYEIFGDAAFQRYENGKPLGRFNRAIFDIFVVSLARAPTRAALIESRARIADLLPLLLETNKDFNAWTQSTTKSQSAVFGRIQIWSAAVHDAIGVTIEPAS